MPIKKFKHQAKLGFAIGLLFCFSHTGAALAQNYIPATAELVNLNGGKICAIGSSKNDTSVTPNIGAYYLTKNGQNQGVWMPVTSQTTSVSALEVGTDITSIQTSPSEQPYINSAVIWFYVIANPGSINCSDITFTFTNTTTGDLTVPYYPYPHALFEMTAWESANNNVLTVDTSNVDTLEAPLMIKISKGATTYAELGNPVYSAHDARTTIITGPHDMGGQESPFVAWLKGQPGYANGPQLFEHLALSSAPTSPEQYPYAMIQSPTDFLVAKCVDTPSGYVPPSCNLANATLHWSDPLNSFFDVELANFFQNAYTNPGTPLIVMGDAHGSIAEAAWTATSNTANCPIYQVADGKSLQLKLNSDTIVICNPVDEVVPMAGSPIRYDSNTKQVQITQQQYDAYQKYVGWNLGQPDTGFVGTITNILSERGNYYIALNVLDGAPNLSYPVWAFSNIKYGLGLNLFETASEMVFANDGAFSSWTAQYISNSDLQTVALSIERNIVAAFTRGIANCNNVTMAAGGQPPAYCANVTKAAAINPDAANASDAYWMNEANWYPTGGVQDYYAQYIHTARLDGGGNIVPGTSCPTAACSNIDMVPNNSIAGGVTESNQGIAMAMAYAFGYDENPVYVTQASQVPSKLDPIPTDWGTGLGLAVIIGRSWPSQASHDFNGDDKSDIAWRDSTGNTALWLMNGAQISSSGGFGAVPTIWSIVGQGDFDGDGKADLLWRDSSGNIAIWFLNGLQIVSTAGIGNIPTTWSVAGVADFDGDGKTDILWRDGSGDVAIWFMNGAQIASTGFVGNVPTSWSIVGVADFDGDGKADILWRDIAGNTAIWFMNGAQVSSFGGLGAVPAAWSVAATGDFDGDGKADILWHDTSGNTAIWFMNGAQVASTAGLGQVPMSWMVQETGDFDGDGKSDILWRDTSGNTAIWFINGAQVASTASLGNIPTSWMIQTLNAN
jgi:FG-GAP-like repeat